MQLTLSLLLSGFEQTVFGCIYSCVICAQGGCWGSAHGQAFRQATDARSGAHILAAVSLCATRTCARALFASCSQSAVEDNGKHRETTTTQ